MDLSTENRFPGPVSVFRDSRLPEEARPAGYSALIDAYELKVPLPRQLTAIGRHHRTVVVDRWRLLTPRHAPPATLAGHLAFALKYEGLDLAVLKRLFLETGANAISAIVRETPTGSYARRIWFLYEWLTGRRLDLPNATRGKYVLVIDPSLQLAGAEVTSSRHRVRNNLPGTPDFCPLVFRTEKLDELLAYDFAANARQAIAAVPRDVMSRTAAFLLVKDSRASFAIEGERPPQRRIERWARALGEAGRNPLDLTELLRLQRVIIGDARFVPLGLRTEGGFVGEHDRETRRPLPEHISARPDDLPTLVDAILQFNESASHNLHPIVAAAVLAFGFVYVHPFADGNGRIHRYLIHHVLADRDLVPRGLVFPVSAAILDRIDDYRRVLQSYSSRLFDCIEWKVADDHNVRVTNDTADFYRFFDATPQALFLCECVRRTIEHHLPEEAVFLQRYDSFSTSVQDIVDMPEKTVNLLFSFLRGNGGRLSRRARTREFASLSDDEIARIESIYVREFDGNSHGG